MVSEQCRMAAWQTLLETARVVRYYDAMSKRYSTYEHCLSVVLGISGAGGVISLVAFFVDDPEPWMRLWGAGMVAVVIVNLVLKPGGKAMLLAVVRSRLDEQELRSRDLWLRIDTDELDDAQVREEVNRIMRAANEVMQISSTISTAKRLNQRCTEQTYIAEADRYAA